jgi:hypothetical protein
MSESRLSFRQTFDDRIEIGQSAYRFDKSLPKPCLHPLVTDAGHVLSGFEMSDHVWHRGLWFTIKFINGTNFWEEQAPFGVQVSQRQPVCEFVDDGALRVTHLLDWTSEATGKALTERRVMVCRSGQIDWTTELHAAQDVTLDRTPYTTWGGYGGLSFRASRELHNVNFLLPGGETIAALAGQPHDWVSMNADVDGGPGQKVAMAMIDHPSNPRSPSPWYCKSGNGFNYMNAAFLFHEPMTLARGVTLRLAYRVLYRDGQWTANELAQLAAAFRKTEIGA